MSADDQKLVKNLKEELLVTIEEEMRTQHISQAELARRAGALRRNVNQIMARKRSVTLDLLLRFAEVIDLEIELKVKGPRK